MMAMMAIFGFSIFLVLLFLIVVNAGIPKLFGKKRGRSHRLFGATYLLMTPIGLYLAVIEESPIYVVLCYDVVLGVLGIVLTLTAASGFPHDAKPRGQRASGTLERRALVTTSEMIEHSFYQILNLIQVLYLHSIPYVSLMSLRCALLIAVTFPWMFRGRFPVNKFSDNYKETNEWSTEKLMYRIKKAQYLIYKHFIFHGMNVRLIMFCVTYSLNSTSLLRCLFYTDQRGLVAGWHRYGQIFSHFLVWSHDIVRHGVLSSNTCQEKHVISVQHVDHAKDFDVFQHSPCACPGLKPSSLHSRIRFSTPEYISPSSRNVQHTFHCDFLSHIYDDGPFCLIYCCSLSLSLSL